MTRNDFLAALRASLSGLPEEDIRKSLEYYDEMISDRTEDGCTEEAAVEALGSVEEVSSQILMQTPLPKLVKAKVRTRQSLRGWEIALLVLGSPLWLPLILTALILFLTVYIVIWAVIISLYAVVFSLAVSALACIAAAVYLIITGPLPQGILVLGGSLICAGAAILLFLGFNQVTKGLLLLSKKILIGVKSCFVRKGNTK